MPRASLQPRPAVFFDRDVVLNHDCGYTHTIEDLNWVETARQAVKFCNDAGYFVFVVTNQAGIARGYYDEEAVRRLHRHMNEELLEQGARIDDFRYCPHHPEGSVPELAKPCQCRKPHPGMILSLLHDWPIIMAGSVMFGDKQSDIEAAEAAGLPGVLFTGSSLLPVVEATLSKIRNELRSES